MTEVHRRLSFAVARCLQLYRHTYHNNNNNDNNDDDDDDDDDVTIHKVQ